VTLAAFDVIEYLVNCDSDSSGDYATALADLRHLIMGRAPSRAAFGPPFSLREL
jgi:hypothetical protein